MIGSQCGASPLSASFNGLQTGNTYYYTISNASGGTQGPFQTCLTTSSPPPVPGQDCTSAAVLCNSNGFTQGTYTGVGAAENIATNTCFGLNERQSKWYTFTVSTSGTLGFVISPTNTNDDYDWALWNTSSSPCASTMPVPVACNWSGCPGPTGISANPAAEGAFACTGPSPCGGGVGYKSFCNETVGNASLINATAGTTYTLLIDNFSANGNGFNFSFRGTATIGPNAQFTYTTLSCSSYNFTKTSTAANSSLIWQFGDGQTSTSSNPSHTYASSGTYVVT